MVADRRAVQRWGRYADAITRWEHITGRPAPAPALLNDADGPRPAPAFVEWLMGLPTGWVTDADDLSWTSLVALRRTGWVRVGVGADGTLLLWPRGEGCGGPRVGRMEVSDA